MDLDEFFEPSTRYLEVRDELRRGYLETISEAATEAIGQLIMPNDQASMALDIAQFTAFLMVEKLADAMGVDKADRWVMKRLWGKINKSMEQEIPLMLNEYAEATRRGEV